MYTLADLYISYDIYNNGSGLNCWQILIFTYVYALIFIHSRFGSFYWLLRVLIGSLIHKKNGSLSQSLGVFISFRDSGMVLSESFYNLFISVSNTSFEKKVVLDQ